MTSSEIHNFNPSILKIAKSIHGTNIAFVIDTSDSMPSNLELIKAFTIELIDIFMCQLGSYSFNVISFAETYTKLSNILLPCCKSTATLAGEWIQTLNCDTSKNTLLALGTAYTDNEVDAVIMLTDGLLTQKLPEVIKCVSELSQGRPLHIIYINEEGEDDNVLQFLETLAVCTNGTLHTIKHKSKCVLQEEQIYPIDASYGVNSDSSSSSVSSSDNSIENEEENCEDEEAEEIKLLGKVVLAKKNSNGYYYKGTIIKTTSSSEDVVVLFDSSKDKTAQLQQTCLLSELIFYDDAKEEKIYADDKVLVNLEGKKRFIPASVIKKEYIFGDAVKEDVHFTKVLEVELINGDTRSIPISSAVHIALDCYDRIVNGIKDKSSKKTQTSDENDKEETKEPESENLEDISAGLLRDKIERQLRESEEFLQSLNTKAKEDISCNGENKKNYSDSSLNSSFDNQYPKKSKVKVHNRPFCEDDESYVPPLSTPRATPTCTSLHSPYNTEKHCRFIEPHPPVSWNNGTKIKRSSCANPRTMRRSASVGCNVVEMSKKHWKGRPTSKETSPKRPFNERYIIKPRIGAPKAEEYQTTDGVPFPIKTDNRFKRAKCSSWTPGAKKTGDYLLHDIISHRIVNPNKPNEKLNLCEEKQGIKEKKRITARRTKQKLREEKEAEASECRENQLEGRDEQVRKQIEDRVKDEFSKIRITIEKDDAIQKNKQHKQEQQRKFEREREGKNQERKHTRIAALKERKKNYVAVEDERVEEPLRRNQHVQTYRRTRDEKQSEFERSRIEKQIEDHESKINRLKELRRSTEARFRSMRKDNDNHRDINYYVKDQQQGTTRAGILP